MQVNHHVLLRLEAVVPCCIHSIATNGHSHASTNGTSNGTVGNNLKRTADQASLEDDLVRKKGKVMEGKQIMDTDDIQVIEDEKDDGVITLD